MTSIEIKVNFETKGKDITALVDQALNVFIQSGIRLDSYQICINAEDRSGCGDDRSR